MDISRKNYSMYCDVESNLEKCFHIYHINNFKSKLGTMT